MKLALILACICMTGSSATIVWAVNKQPRPQIMCPNKVTRGQWWI